MKRFILLYLFLAPFYLSAQNTPIVVDPSMIGDDRAHHAAYFEDRSGALGIEEVMKLDSGSFQKIRSHRKNFGRPLQPVWVRFKVKNPSDRSQDPVLLETSRAMTNKIRLYQVRNGEVVDHMRSGDHVPFSEHPFTHRRPIFPVQLKAGETNTFYLKIEAEGATVVLSLKAWTKEAFQSFDQKERLLLGLFYGFLIFVILIFSFFYFELKERSFLFYFLYVINIGLLLFCLDGFSYRFFFPEAPYLADRAVLFFSFSSIMLHLLYGRDYLRFWKYLPRTDRLAKTLILLAGIGILMGCSYGTLYLVAFPFSHVFSFFSPVFLLACSIYLRSKGHAISIRFLLAFGTLIVGIIFLLLGNVGLIPPSPVTVHWLKIGVLGEVIFLSLTMAEKYRQLRLEKEQARKESLEKLQELNKLKDEYNKELEEKVAQRTAQLEERTEELEIERAKLREVNQNVFSSIRYAERIQNAILPRKEEIEPLFRDHFIFFRPRDIVSGDIYWMARVRTSTPEENSPSSIPQVVSKQPAVAEGSELIVFAAVDCTGHGVPGAFLSILGHDILNRTVQDPQVNSPGQALQHLDDAVQRTFERSQGGDESIKDGMDMGMCALDRSRMILYFAGAQNPCYIIREGELFELKGDKQVIGGSTPNEEKKFTDHRFEVQQGDAIYLFSDGYPDQFGGPKGKKFKYKAFKELLIQVHHKEMSEQHRIIEETFDDWKGEHEQIDDVLVIGVRV